MRSGKIVCLLASSLTVLMGRVGSSPSLARSYLPPPPLQTTNNRFLKLECNVEVLREMCMDVDREVCQTVTEVESRRY